MSISGAIADPSPADELKNDAPTNADIKVAHRAFWIMARRVTVVAACVDFGFLILFLALGSPLLAWVNVASIATYAAANWLILKRRNNFAVLLIWLEVLGHAALGSMLVGWDSGFHYYLLMFIPAIVVSGRKSSTVVMLFVLLAFYLGLHAASRTIGVIEPLSSAGLTVVHTFNVAIVFAMASYIARFYYHTVLRAERRLIELATQDSLTGLSNRRNFLARAELEIARSRRSGEAISLIIADIDYFKQINDQYGHEAGDRVIAGTGSFLMKMCRAQDIVARWGGEEFLLLLPATKVDAAAVSAERIRHSFASKATEHDGHAIRCTLSLGVAELRSGEPLREAIARADRALYASKSQGRDRLTVAD